MNPQLTVAGDVVRLQSYLSDEPRTVVVLGAEKAVDRSVAEVTARLVALPTRPGGATPDTIARWVAEAAHQLSDAHVQGFIPVLVEHIVRTRMGVVARER